MKYILLQNTSYTRRPLYIIDTLEHFNKLYLYRQPHIKPILISTSKEVLKSLEETLTEKYTK